MFNEITVAFRANERALHADLYDKVRHACEVHRQVRHHAQSFIKPGIKLIDMCEQLEECNRRLVKENGLQVMQFQKRSHFAEIAIDYCFL
jgi:methionyl aminopeptidase